MAQTTIVTAVVRVERGYPSGGWLLRVLIPTSTMKLLMWSVHADNTDIISDFIEVGEMANY